MYTNYLSQYLLKDFDIEKAKISFKQQGFYKSPVPLYTRDIQVPAYIKGIIALMDQLRIPTHSYVISGGFVRDLVLGTPSRDIDICVSPNHIFTINHAIEKIPSFFRKRYDPDLVRDLIYYGDVAIDFITSTAKLAYDFDYTVNQLYIFPDLSVRGTARSWFDIDTKTLRHNENNHRAPNLRTLLRGLRIASKNDLVIPLTTMTILQGIVSTMELPPTTFDQKTIMQELVKANESTREKMFSLMWSLDFPTLGHVDYPALYTDLIDRRDNGEFSSEELNYEEDIL